MDNDAPNVANTFYGHIFDNGTAKKPHTTRSAEALHLAVKELRNKPCSFKRWVPFIHLGL